MPHDFNLQLASGSTQTASHNETGIPIPGTRRSEALYAHIIWSAGSLASGSGTTVQFKVQHSQDNSTYYDHVVNADEIITLTTTAAHGEIWLPISTDKPFVRLAEVLTLNSGVSPTITYDAFVVLSKV